jgi:S1-C subfamily serine protease
LDYGASFDGRMATRYGMRVTNLGEPDQAYHQRKGGALVREIWTGYRADQAGLVPGDVIIGLEGKPVSTADDLEVLVLPLSLEVFELMVLRGPRTMRIGLRARPPSSAAAAEQVPSGLKFSTTPAGFPIDSVAPDSPAARAGIRAGDRLLKIGHQDPRNQAAVENALSQRRTRPLHVVVERGDRRWEAILE